MVDYTIYDITEYSGEPKNFVLTDEYEAYEMGLSPGELRQSLLDRFKAELDSKELSFINESFRFNSIDLEATEEDIETDCSKKGFIEEIDQIIYDHDDDFFASTIWGFHNEMIYIAGE